MSIERLVRKQLHGPGRRSRTRLSGPQDPDMISLAAGDPNFLLPDYIANAVNNAIKIGQTHYCFGGDQLNNAGYNGFARADVAR